MLYKYLLMQAKEENVYSILVGGVVLKSNKFILLERRKNSFMEGLLEIPSGKIEFGEGIKECLERQIKEELSVSIKDIKKYIGHFDYLSNQGKTVRQFNFLVSINDEKNISLSEEHSKFEFLDMSECLNNNQISNELMNILLIANSFETFKLIYKEKKI